MNLIEKIGAYIAAGLTSAEAAVKLDVEHGIQVTEDWINKIRGADGFAVVVDAAKADVGAAVAEVDEEVGKIAGVENNVGADAGPTVEK